MNLPNKWASQLFEKDKNKARQAADHIINTPDIEAWKCLVENGEYLFDYIKEKAGQNLVNSFKKEGLSGLFSLLNYHSSDWDWVIAEIFAMSDSAEINSQMLNLLKAGSPEEKAYASKYFTLIKDNNAAEPLLITSKDEYEPLKINSAQALGFLEDKQSYDYYIDKLQSRDDWEKTEAAQFLAGYGNPKAVIPILKAMLNSGMGEYLAGEAATLTDLNILFESEEDSERELALTAFDNILSGLSEIWGLSALFDFKVYDCIEKLIELIKTEDSPLNGRYAQLLLKSKAKISMFAENNQYTFDEDKTVVGELNEINRLLCTEDDNFWNMVQKSLLDELTVNSDIRKFASISIIKEIKLVNAIEALRNLALSQDESQLIICEAFITLLKLDDTSIIQNKEGVFSRINDPNLLALAKAAVTV